MRRQHISDDLPYLPIGCLKGDVVASVERVIQSEQSRCRSHRNAPVSTIVLAVSKNVIQLDGGTRHRDVLTANRDISLRNGATCGDGQVTRAVTV